MATVTLKGNPFNTNGNLPAIGSRAPDFTLTRTDLSQVSLKDFAGKTVVLSIFPSVDTPTCAASVRRFNTEVSRLPDTVVLCASADLPFAHARFCGAEGLTNVLSVSDVRDKGFGDRYGVKMIDGPLTGLLARSVVVIAPDGTVKQTELVDEITHEPDYDAAIKTVKG